MAFIQLIEITSSRVSEIEALTEEWQAQTEGQRTAVRGTSVTLCRDPKAQSMWRFLPPGISVDSKAPSERRR